MANFASAMMGLQQQQQGDPPFSLTSLINHDNVGGIVAGNQELRAALLPLLPEGLQVNLQLLLVQSALHLVSLRTQLC